MQRVENLRINIKNYPLNKLVSDFHQRLNFISNKQYNSSFLWIISYICDELKDLNFDERKL